MSRPYHHGDLRRALVDAGRALLVEDPEGELTLREVARRAGVSHNAPYRHFAGLPALLDAVAAQVLTDLADELRAAAAPAPAVGSVIDRVTDRLAAVGTAYVRFVVHRPAEARVVFATPKSQRAPDSPVVVAGHQAIGVLVALVEEGQRGGRLAPGAPIEVATTLWALVHGIATLVAAGQLPDAVADPDAFVTAHIDRLVGGLTAPAPAPARRRWSDP